MLKLSSIMIGTSQADVLGKFYEHVFNRGADMNEGGWYGWNFDNKWFTVGSHSEVHGQAKEPARNMFVFETTELKEEFERIKGIEGATVIKEPYEMGGGWIATLADPDGNYFQLMTPWEQ